MFAFGGILSMVENGKVCGLFDFLVLSCMPGGLIGAKWEVSVSFFIFFIFWGEGGVPALGSVVFWVRGLVK